MSRISSIVRSLAIAAVANGQKFLLAPLAAGQEVQDSRNGGRRVGRSVAADRRRAVKARNRKRNRAAHR